LKRVIIVLISASAIAFVFYKLYTFPNWEFLADYSNRKIEFATIIVIQLVLLFISLLLESLKWQVLISPLKKIDIKKAFYQVLKGIQGGIISPARLGDPPARAILLPKDIRLFAIGYSFVGSFVQNIIIGIGALVGLFFVKNDYLNKVNSHFIKYFLLILLFLLAILVVVIFLSTKQKKSNRKNKIAQFIKHLKEFNSREIILIFAYSLVKYIVFCGQLFIFLQFFNVINIENLALIAIYFGVITIIPSFAIADLGIRGSIALFIFGTISTNSAAIVIAIFLLWIINLAVPAVIPVIYSKRE